AKAEAVKAKAAVITSKNRDMYVLSLNVVRTLGTADVWLNRSIARQVPGDCWCPVASALYQGTTSVVPISPLLLSSRTDFSR
ncbi:MAG: hypothetical protein ACLPND_18185, partial [Candidatus Korobacteraceae bacterium]